MAIIDGRGGQVQSVITRLKNSKHLPIVGSVGRLRIDTFHPSKTYIFGSGAEGHLAHWIAIAHIRALFTAASRKLKIPLHWAQHAKHKLEVPDAHLSLPWASWALEIDRSTEGMKADRLAGKLRNARYPTLVVTMKSKERMFELCDHVGEWDGKTLVTSHTYFHKLERDGFNIISEPFWWDGEAWVSLEMHKNGGLSG